MAYALGVPSNHENRHRVRVITRSIYLFASPPLEKGGKGGFKCLENPPMSPFAKGGSFILNLRIVINKIGILILTLIPETFLGNLFQYPMAAPSERGSEPPMRNPFSGWMMIPWAQPIIDDQSSAMFT